MSYVVAGYCPHCGAPLYVPSAWWGITPPPVTYSCACRLNAVPNISPWRPNPNNPMYQQWKVDVISRGFTKEEAKLHSELLNHLSQVEGNIYDELNKDEE